MKTIITAILIGLASVLAQAQNTYDTNGSAFVSLTSGEYILTSGTNETSWSLDGTTFRTNWPASNISITNGLYLQGIPSSIVTLAETPAPVINFYIPVTTNPAPPLAIGIIKVPSYLVDGTIVALEHQAGVGASVQLSSTNLSRIILLNNEDGWWTIKCDPK